MSGFTEVPPASPPQEDDDVGQMETLTPNDTNTDMIPRPKWSIDSNSQVEHSPDDEEKTDDAQLSAQCMINGVLPLGQFYEDLDFVQLSRYQHGIPSGLEGMRRRLIAEDGLKYEGIFRLRGRDSTLKNAEQMLAANEAISKIEANPIEVAQLMKAFYRKIPCDEPGYIPESLMHADTENEIINGFSTMSEPRKSLLLWTFDLWIDIEDMTLFNKMSLQSMAIVFSPNMVRCGSANPMVFLELQKSVQRITLMAAKLRRENRLILDVDPTRRNNIVPFKADRTIREEIPVMDYPTIRKQSNSTLGSFFKNCVLL